MAIGLSAFWIIALYIADELSYDRFHKNTDRIYRVVHSASWDKGSFKLVPTSPPYAPNLKKEYPEIEKAVRISPEGGGVITFKEKVIKAHDIFMADSNFFEVFTYEFLHGIAKTALNQPRSIVLSRTLAEKIFGSAEKALNQTVFFDGDFPNVVTGVIEDVPSNSHIHFSGIRSLDKDYNGGWQQFYVSTYLLLHRNADYKKLQGKFPGFFEKYIKKEMGDVNYKLQLQPLTSIHLHSNMDYEMGKNGNITNVYIFVAIAFLILIIAAINYMNLSTARSLVRVREVGVRKVIGSSKGQLVLMFLAESIIITFFASLLALIITQYTLPFFEEIAGKDLSLWAIGTTNTLALLTIFSLFIGVLSGIYPAVFLSGFSTVGALKRQIGSQFTTTLFRKSLVSFEFVISIIMIAATWIIYQQLIFANTKDLGFNKKQVFTFHVEQGEARKQINALKEKLLQSPLLESVAVAGNPIGLYNLGGGGVSFEKNGMVDEPNQMTQRLAVDHDFVNTLELKIKEGRNFSKDRPGELYNSALVNETLVKAAGWKDPIGKRIRFYIDGEGNTAETKVIGVVKDFHVYSLQHKIEPLFIQMPLDFEQDNLYVRVSPKAVAAALKYTEEVYKQFDKVAPFEASFLDQNFSKQYESEQKQGKLILIFAVLSIVIACLGLFGLTTYTIQQRTKEIGIRKVLGASIGTIVALLSKDYLKLVAIAAAIAIPIAWFGMHKWLENFAYKIEIQWWTLLIAGALPLLIALITLSFQAIKAAVGNPVKSIRNDG